MMVDDASLIHPTSWRNTPHKVFFGTPPFNTQLNLKTSIE